METTIGTTRITVAEGDLTSMPLDVVVNAANEHLQHRGGLALALARTGGPVVQESSDRWVREHGPVRSGVAITPAGSMPARTIVHAVGPRWKDDGTEEPVLIAAVTSALHACVAVGARTVGLPAISSGIFGYPLADATRVITQACVDWCRRNPGSLDEIRLVGYDAAVSDAFASALDRAGVGS